MSSEPEQDKDQLSERSVADFADMELVFETLNRESDRGAILVAVSHLDNILEEWIRACMRQDHQARKLRDDMFKYPGVLSSFAAKVQTCYLLCRMPTWLFEDLEIIRKIRNEVAHNTQHADFESEHVVRLTKRLQGASKAVASKEYKKSADESAGETPKQQQDSSQDKRYLAYGKMSLERFRFTLTVAFIVGFVSGFREYFETRELKLWPVPRGVAQAEHSSKQ